MRKLFLILIMSFLMSGLSFAATDVNLSWQDNSSGLNQEDGFNIERISAIRNIGEVTSNPDPNGVWVNIGSVGPDVVAFVDTGVTNFQCYRVNAFNAAGISAYSNIACLELQPPGAPGNLVKSVTVTLVLKWEDGIASINIK